MTAGRTFVDTKVLVHAVDDAEPNKRARARALLADPPPGGLVLSTQVLIEFYVVVTRKLSQPLSEDLAEAAVARLSRLPVVVTDADLIGAGIIIARSSQISPWDGLIVAAARAGGCDRLHTEDLGDGTVIEGVRIENPFA